MARKHLFELLQEKELDVQKEFRTLDILFSAEKCIYESYKAYSVKNIIDGCVFRNLSFRGTYLSVDSMREELGIAKVNKYTDMDDLFVFCELLKNIFVESRYLIQRFLDDGLDAYKAQITSISRNMDVILETFGYRWFELDRNRWIIVENNKTAIEAAELVEDENVAIQIMEYNHFALAGDLGSKNKILNALGKYLEPVLRSKKSAASEELSGDVSFLLNNFHIRHNNEAGKNRNEYVARLTDKELESWYDKTYTAMIGLIVVNEWSDIHNEIKEIKKKF